jgi:hypothetical protein
MRPIAREIGCLTASSARVSCPRSFSRDPRAAQASSIATAGLLPVQSPTIMKNGLLSTIRAPFFAGLVLVASTSVLAPACSSDETTPTAPGPIAVDALRAELQTASCEFFVRCGYMPDQALCLDVSSPSRETLQLLADVVFGKVTYDAAAARACVDALRGQSCDALASVAKGIEQACANVFRGTVAEGGACLFDDECSGDSACDVSMCMGGGACCVGVCTAKPALVPIGGDCMTEPCISTAYCDVENDEMGMVVSATCKAQVKNGEACTDTNGCEDGLRCDTGGSDACYVLSKEGQTCNPNLQTGGCLRVDNWCSADGKCVKLPTVGEPCTDKNECLKHAYCDAGTCKSRPIEGQDCVMDGPQCLGSLQCEMDDMLMKAVCKRSSLKEVCVLDNAEVSGE